METVKIQNGKVILKNGKVSCTCCCFCDEIKYKFLTIRNPPSFKTRIKGPSKISLEASNVDGTSKGWSITITGTFKKTDGINFSFPTTTLSIPECLPPFCSPSVKREKKEINIPKDVCGVITFEFSLSGNDCCDEFIISLCQTGDSGEGIGLSLL